MVEQSQGVAAASASPSSTLGTEVTFELGGVTLGVVGTPYNYPAQPDPAALEFVWPTSSLAFGKMILMQDGAQWKMWKPPVRASDGSTQISLRPVGSTVQATFNVHPDDTGLPIWNLGTVLPPVIQQPDPTPDPNAPTDPIPPQTPVDLGDTNQPPADPPQTPVEP